jgi:translation initiation factor IF-2
LLALKHMKEDAATISQGMDCGVSLAGFEGVQVGDKLECFERRPLPKTLAG